MKEETKSMLVIAGLGLACLLIFSGILFGWTGVRVILLGTIIFAIPTYYLLGAFGLEQDEQFILTPFISLLIIPSGAFYISYAFGSLMASTIVTIVLVLVAGFLLRKWKGLNTLTPKEEDEVKMVV